MPTVKDKQTGQVYSFDWNSPTPPTHEDLGRIVEQKRAESNPKPNIARRAFDFMTSPIPGVSEFVKEHKPSMPGWLESTAATVANPAAALTHNISKFPEVMKRPFFSPLQDSDRMKLEEATPTPLDVVGAAVPLKGGGGFLGHVGKAARAAEVGVGAGMVGAGIGEAAEGKPGQALLHTGMGAMALLPGGKKVPHITEEGIPEGLSRGYLAESAEKGAPEAGWFGRGTGVDNQNVMGSSAEINKFTSDMEKTFGSRWPEHVLDDIPDAAPPIPLKRAGAAPAEHVPYDFDLAHAIEDAPQTGRYDAKGSFGQAPRLAEKPATRAMFQQMPNEVKDAGRMAIDARDSAMHRTVVNPKPDMQQVPAARKMLNELGDFPELSQAVHEADAAVGKPVNLGHLPPVPKDHTRLFRGEGPLSQKGSNWFTTEASEAGSYQQGGNLLYTDVPTARIEQMNAGMGRSSSVRGEFQLPEGYVAKARSAAPVPKEGLTPFETRPSERGAITLPPKKGKWSREQIIEKIGQSGGDLRSIKEDGTTISWKDSAGNARSVDLTGRVGPRNFAMGARAEGTNPRAVGTNERSPLLDEVNKAGGAPRTDAAIRAEMLARKSEQGALTFSGPGKAAPTTPGTATPSIQPKSATLASKVVDVANISRTLKSAIDLSMPIRQAGLFTARHPVMAMKAGKNMLKSLLKEDNYMAFMDELHSRNNAITGRYHDAGLAITEHPQHAGLGQLNNREEAFLSTLADKVPGVRGSNRAAVAYLNTARADLFDHLATKFKGLEVADKDIAKYVNIVTGRAGLGKQGERMAGALQAILFSPRFLASRIQSVTHAIPGGNSVSKAVIGKGLLDPRLQSELRKDWAAYGSAFAATLAVAKMSGADVSVDPRSADFLKIRTGNTRIDIGGSYPQLGRLVAQLWDPKRTTPEGKSVPVGGKKENDLQRRGDVAVRFARSKLNPPAGLLATAYSGKNFVGEPFDAGNKYHWLREGLEMHTPMFPSDLVNSINENGPVKGSLLAIPSLVGGSTDVYDPKDRSRDDPDKFEKQIKNWRKTRFGKLITEGN